MAKILLIDDDNSVRDILGKTLTYFGHAVTTACNGREGLELFALISPDLVITDIVMPEKEGLEVLMALRTQRPPVKIIAMSGGGRGNAADYLHIAKCMGASVVLAKPFSHDQLLSAIASLLPPAGLPASQPAQS